MKQKNLIAGYLIGLIFVFSFPVRSLASAGVLGDSCNFSNGTSCQVGLICSSQSKVCELPATPSDVNQYNQKNLSSEFIVPGPQADELMCNNGVCLPANQECSSGSLGCANTLPDFLIKIISLLLYFSGILAVLFVVIGGIMYIISGGNEEKVKEAKKTLLNAIIGVVIITMAYAIVSVIMNLVNGISGN